MKKTFISFILFFSSFFIYSFSVNALASFDLDFNHTIFQDVYLNSAQSTIDRYVIQKLRNDPRFINEYSNILVFKEFRLLKNNFSTGNNRFSTTSYKFYFIKDINNMKAVVSYNGNNRYFHIMNNNVPLTNYRTTTRSFANTASVDTFFDLFDNDTLENFTSQATTSSLATYTRASASFYLDYLFDEYYIFLPMYHLKDFQYFPVVNSVGGGLADFKINNISLNANDNVETLYKNSYIKPASVSTFNFNSSLNNNFLLEFNVTPNLGSKFKLEFHDIDGLNLDNVVVDYYIDDTLFGGFETLATDNFVIDFSDKLEVNKVKIYFKNGVSNYEPPLIFPISAISNDANTLFVFKGERQFLPPGTELPPEFNFSEPAPNLEWYEYLNPVNWGSALNNFIIKPIAKLFTWLITALSDLFKSLFIPKIETINNFFNEMHVLFVEKFGILLYPFEVIFDFFNRCLNIPNNTDGIIFIPAINDPVFNVFLFGGFNFNLKEIFLTGTLNNIYNIYYLVANASIVFLFVNFCLKKFNDFVR